MYVYIYIYIYTHTYTSVPIPIPIPMPISIPIGELRASNGHKRRSRGEPERCPPPLAYGQISLLRLCLLRFVDSQSAGNPLRT